MKWNGPTAQSLSDIFSVVDIDFPANHGRYQCPMLAQLGTSGDVCYRAAIRGTADLIRTLICGAGFMSSRPRIASPILLSYL